jgi:hypothetical protein
MQRAIYLFAVINRTCGGLVGVFKGNGDDGLNKEELSEFSGLISCVLQEVYQSEYGFPG